LAIKNGHALATACRKKDNMKVKEVTKDNAEYGNAIKILLEDEVSNEVFVPYSSYDAIKFFKDQNLWQDIYDNMEEEVFFKLVDQYYVEQAYNILKQRAESKLYGGLI